MDEPVRWVSKAEAAQELEISLSTLERMYLFIASLA